MLSVSFGKKVNKFECSTEIKQSNTSCLQSKNFMNEKNKTQLLLKTITFSKNQSKIRNSNLERNNFLNMLY